MAKKKAQDEPGSGLSVPVTVRPNGIIDVGTPVALFTMRPGAEVVASPDGQRFLIGTLVGDTKVPSPTVILNWKALLKK